MVWWDEEGYLIDDRFYKMTVCGQYTESDGPAGKARLRWSPATVRLQKPGAISRVSIAVPSYQLSWYPTLIANDSRKSKSKRRTGWCEPILNPQYYSLKVSPRPKAIPDTDADRTNRDWRVLPITNYFPNKFERGPSPVAANPHAGLQHLVVAWGRGGSSGIFQYSVFTY
jgi:hypothetical protein